MNSVAMCEVGSLRKEAKFVSFVCLALLAAIMMPLMDVYLLEVVLSVSAVVAMLMALFGVRFWVRLLTMPLVLVVTLVAAVAVQSAIGGNDTGSRDADVDAQIFSSRLLMRCPFTGPITQTESGRNAKAEFEKDGARLDDMRMLPWRSYLDRHRRCEVLARLGAKYGLVAPLAVMGLHVCLAVLCAMITWKLRKGVCRTAAGWTLAILVLPWIDTLIGWGPADPDCDPIFVVPDYLPFFNEMPELLLASVIQLGVFVAAVRCGWSRPEKCRPAKAEAVASCPGASTREPAKGRFASVENSCDGLKCNA